MSLTDKLGFDFIQLDPDGFSDAAFFWLALEAQTSPELLRSSFIKPSESSWKLS